MQLAQVQKIQQRVPKSACACAVFFTVTTGRGRRVGGVRRVTCEATAFGDVLVAAESNRHGFTTNCKVCMRVALGCIGAVRNCSGLQLKVGFVEDC